jgi:predicted acyltransferase (DUF342 family)
VDIERIVDAFVPGKAAHVVRPGALVQQGLRAPSDLVVGKGARILGGIDAGGHVHLAQDAAVAGDVRAGHDVVVGAGASVAGSVKAEGRVFLLARALVAGEVDAAGDVVVRPGVRCDRIACGGDLLLEGPAETGELAVRGRIKFG